MRRAPAASSASAIAKSPGVRDLEVLGRAGDQLRRQADRLDRAASSVAPSPARASASREHAEAKHLRRLRLPDALARRRSRRRGRRASRFRCRPPARRAGRRPHRRDRRRSARRSTRRGRGSARRRAPAPSRRPRRRGAASSARPAATVAARVAPPQRASDEARIRRHVGSAARSASSSGASTTRIALEPRHATSAASVCATIGRPAISTYCLASWRRRACRCRRTARARCRRAAGGGSRSASARRIDRDGPRISRGPRAARRAPPKIDRFRAAAARPSAAFMLLPDIAPGKRFALPRPPGSADALLLARFAEKERAPAPRCSAIFTAEPADAQRLADEIPFFAPTLRVAVFPDWETLPYDTLLAARRPDLGAAGDALAHPPRRRRRRPDAGDDGAGAPRAAELHGRLHLPLHDRSSASTRRR